MNRLLLSDRRAETATILGLVLHLIANGLALHLLVASSDLLLGKRHAPGIVRLILLGVG